jgi:3-oxo-5-alpha-steroid 4-dehydrogenase 3
MQAVATLLQLFYALAASAVIFASSVPALRNRFVNYGKTAVAAAAPAQRGSAFAFGRFLDLSAKLTLPHHYFTHFYVVGAASTVFWGWQAWTHGAAYRCVAGIQIPAAVEGRWKARGGGGGGGGGMRIEQVLLAWTCFLAQVCRRLYECLFVQKSGGGSSRMWFVHYLLGIAFYSAMAVSVWIEGTGMVAPYQGGVNFATRWIQDVTGTRRCHR